MILAGMVNGFYVLMIHSVIKLVPKENEEGKIFIESQGWCIIGGVGAENGFAHESLWRVLKNIYQLIME